MNYIRRMKSNTDKRIETVAQLVKAFGGTFALAKWADVVPSTVSNWKEQGHIPPGWHLRLYLECQQRKLNVAPKLFGLSEKGERPPRPNRRAEARSAAV
jgi:predicted SpoU family rRNA methylase